MIGPDLRANSRRSWWLIGTVIMVVSVVIFFGNKFFVSPSPTAPNVAIQPDFSKISQNYLTVISQPTKPFIDAKSYVLVDGITGSVLFDHNGATSAPIGSTTKMVTALVSIEKYQSNKVITITPAAAAINGSTIGLKTGDQLPLNSALEALLIPSANEVAYSLAEASGTKTGDYQTFVGLMNDYVVNHHLSNTHFLDPAGLNDDGHSTAADLAQIGRLVMNNSLLSSIVTKPATNIAPLNAVAPTGVKNTDQLIQQTSSLFYNPKVIGIKTGFTPLAGYCLVAAENFHNHLLIGVVLGVPGNGETASAKEINKLFVWADQNVTVKSY